MSDRESCLTRARRRREDRRGRWFFCPAGRVLAGYGLLALLLGAAPCMEARAADAADSAATAIGLAIQGISLMNGEDGIELWRLKATWGHLSKDGDTVTVDKPVVRYTLGDPALEDYLHVRSDNGRITDAQRYLRLWDNVVLTRGEETVTGPVLDYDAKTRVLVLPDGAALAGPKGTLHADTLTWKLDDNVLKADGNVDVLLFSGGDMPWMTGAGAPGAAPGQPGDSPAAPGTSGASLPSGAPSGSAAVSSSAVPSPAAPETAVPGAAVPSAGAGK